jgi:hypothetical protein
VDPRTPGKRVTSSTPFAYPYIRGSVRYRRSRAHRNDSVQVHLAMGLPPQHNEAMWRDPPDSCVRTGLNNWRTTGEQLENWS